MNPTAIALLAALGLLGTASVQLPNPYNGKWTISLDGKKTVD